MRKQKHFTNRILAGLLAASVILTGSACSLSEDTKEVKEDRISESEETKETVRTLGVTLYTGENNPLMAMSQEDRDVVSYTHAYILNEDVHGNVLEDSACEVTEDYNASEKSVTYRLALKDGVTFSDGTRMTADDLIFTYYVLCDVSFSGIYTVCNLPVQGLDAYRYNGMSGKAFERKVKKEMKSPSKKTKNKIKKQIIAKELKKEFDWVGTLYENDVYARYTEKYPQRKDLFAFFMNLDGGYDSTKVENEEKVLADITKQYGADYRQLSDATGRDYDEQVKRIAITTLLNGEEDGAASISGIKKLDENTVTITLDGYAPQWMYTLCHVPVLSLASYGDAGAYRYEEHAFGVTKGDVSAIEEKQDGIGAGAYIRESYENTTLTLQARKDYWGKAPEADTLILKNVTVDNAVPALLDGEIEQMQLNGLREEQKTALEEAADTIQVEYTPQNALVYMGLNASAMKVGKDSFSKESVALRQAFATLLSSYKKAAIHNYYGDAATPVDTLKEGLSAAAYDTGINGDTLYQEDMTEYERYDVALDACVSFLREAGYTYDEKSGMFTKAPKGASLSYTATIVADGSGNHAAYAILTSAREALESVGIMLKINDIQDSNALYDLIKGNSQQIFVASMVQEASTDYNIYFGSKGVFNYISYKNADADGIFADMQTFHTREEREELLEQAWAMVKGSAVFVPLYRKNTVTIRRMEKND